MPRYVIPTQSGGYIGVDGPVPYDDTQARFDALADSIAAQSRRPVPMTIQNMPVPRANAPMGPNAGPQRPPVTAPAEVRGVYNPTPINTPQYTQGEVFEAAINQAAPDSIIRDLGQFDYDDYFVVPGGDASVGDTGTYADPYAPGAESREWYLLHGGNPDNVGRLGMSPLAQEGIEYTPPPAATAPEVRGTYNPTPQLYGELGNAARSALTNEYRGAYNPEVRGPVHPSILSSR